MFYFQYFVFKYLNVTTVIPMKRFKKSLIFFFIEI